MTNQQDNKQQLYDLLVLYAKENDRLFIENNMLKGKIGEALKHLKKHRFNKVSELKRILQYDEQIGE